MIYDHIYGETIRYSWANKADNGAPVAGVGLAFSVVKTEDGAGGSALTNDGLSYVPGIGGTLADAIAIVTQDNDYESDLNVPAHYSVICTGGTVATVPMAGEVLLQFWLNRVASTTDLAAAQFENPGAGQTYGTAHPNSPVVQTADNAGAGGTCNPVYYARIVPKRVTVSQQELKIIWYRNGRPLPDGSSQAENVTVEAKDDVGTVRIAQVAVAENSPGTGMFVHLADNSANNEVIPPGDVWQIESTAMIDGVLQRSSDAVRAPV